MLWKYGKLSNFNRSCWKVKSKFFIKFTLYWFVFFLNSLKIYNFQRADAESLLKLFDDLKEKIQHVANELKYMVLHLYK